MKEQIEQIKQTSIKQIEEAKDLKELNDLRVKYLGKKGELTAVLRGLGSLSPEERPIIGGLVNEAKAVLENLIEEKETKFEQEELNKKLEAEKIDITLPSTKMKRGSIHPVNRIIEDIEDLFVSMGYDVVTGPELENDEYCFERLNLPKGHPARDMQDSFYITDEYLLRTQTSAVQARTMMANTEKTPIRMITAGKTYRREDDATHSHQFNQIEGLVIDKKERNVSLADLKGTLEVFVRKIEVLGAGIVHPNVLKMNGYDPEQYGGFAFGTGIDRLAMFRYGITDMRYLYTNDVRFLGQFDRKDEE